MTAPPTPPALAEMADREAAAFKALEEAWKLLNIWADDSNIKEGSEEANGPRRRMGSYAAVIGAASHMLAARHAARDAGYVPVLVSREMVEMVRKHKDTRFPTMGEVSDLLRLLARDLATVLKVDGE